MFFLGFKDKTQKEEFTFWTIQLKPVATEFIQKNIDVLQKKHPEVKLSGWSLKRTLKKNLAAF